MKSKCLVAIMLATLSFIISEGQKRMADEGLIIGKGQMPNVAKDSRGILYVVYGSGDSIMYASSADQCKTFTAPALVAVLPQLSASSMRGPQIAAATDGIMVIACNSSGDIFSYKKGRSGKWSQTYKVNDVDAVAKEGFMALSTYGQNAFAVWLDLRDKHNKIVGAKSSDGGKTWSKNIMIYASPDTTVCECCKPSVAVNGKNVYVMFRNWLHGNRDLYLIQSSDGGNTFGGARKLGKDNWALNGCPMDGGGLVINNKGNPETVWRRKSTIYKCEPGQPEIAIGEGRSCTLESVGDRIVYAWTEKGEVVFLNPRHEKTVLGKGSLPVIKSINNEHILCVWENEKQIHSAIVAW